jgi:hypothetical protein
MASLIQGESPDGRDKTLLPFPDIQAADGNGVHAAPLE